MMNEITQDLLDGRRMLVSAVIEHTAKAAAQKVPERGIFAPVSCAMNYYGTEHEGRLSVRYSQEYGCVVQASVIPNGTSREISNYVFFGSRAECLDWLREPVCAEKLIEIYDQLAEKADDML